MDQHTNGVDKAREVKLRRWATRLGYALHKDRARLWSIDHHGGYRLASVHTNTIEAGERFDLTLDDIEHVLAGIEAGEREGVGAGRTIDGHVDQQTRCDVAASGEGGFVMDRMSASETLDRWGLSAEDSRWVDDLLSAAEAAGVEQTEDALTERLAAEVGRFYKQGDAQAKRVVFAYARVGLEQRIEEQKQAADPA